MQRWKNVLFNIVLCLNCVLVLFVLAGDRLHVPSWLQVVGRMHPLILHFPIVLLILYIVWSIFLQARAQKMIAGPEDEIGKSLLLVTAFTAATAAIMGFLLSKEGGYNQDALRAHKWSGVTVSFLSFIWYSYRDAIHRRKYLPRVAAVLSFALIIFTGHEGSNITHGENYVLAPVMAEKSRPAVPIDQAKVYADLVQPILEAKCITCHNSTKAKGELVMESIAALTKGGRHGALWAPGQPDMSLLMQRIHLPESEKKHMPPVGKPQLDADEVSILFHWIKGGADFNKKVTDLPPSDSLRMLAENLFTSPSEETYTFSAANEKDIEKLTNTNRLIHPLAQGSPALAVNFYNRQNYNNAALKDLLKLKTQVVSLDLAYMPLKDEDVATIAEFSNLRKLNVNFSSIPGKSIAQLKKLQHLRHVSLSGTTVTKQDVENLAGIKDLKSVYLWNAPITNADITALRKQHSNIYFETGFMNDTLLLKLNPPVLETEARIINGAPLAIKMRHYIKGVIIRYTTDGSTPDSMHSPVFADSLMLNDKLVLKARAFKPGWLGSDSVSAAFFKNTFHADSIRAITPLDSVYKGLAGARTLIDGEKAGFETGSGKWLGFRRNNLEMLLYYNEPVNVSTVTLSTLVNISGYIMPPVSVEVWGGKTDKDLVRLARLQPAQPDSIRPASMQGYDCHFNTRALRVIKIVAVPVAKLPPWHPGKGQKGWIFADEIFVN